MTDQAIQFEEVELHRVLGIERGDGFKLSPLSPGVNLIHGPNGSGKSTTARVIQELLWSSRTGLRRATVSGRFLIGETTWQVNIEAGHVEIWLDGQTGAAPELGPAENRHRYHLALHELIIDDNANFAKVIADASQGGYDLEAAIKALGFSHQPSSPRKQAHKLGKARDIVKEVRGKQRRIETGADQLDSLRAQRQLAVGAGAEIALLGKALEFRQTEERCRQFKGSLSDLPEGIAKLRGDERETLDQLTRGRERLKGQLQSEREKIAQAEKELAEVKLPSESVSNESLLALRSRQRKLSQIESNIDQQRETLSRAEAETRNARQRLGSHFTDEQLASLNTVEIGSLSAFARAADKVRAKREVLRERYRWLKRDNPEEVNAWDANTLQEGITALGHWLASPPPASEPLVRSAWPVLLSAVLIAALSISLAVVHHWAWALALIAATGVLAADWWSRHRPTRTVESDQRAVHQSSYESTGLESPEAWEVAVVSDRVRQLIRLAGQQAMEDERTRRRSDLKDDFDTYKQDQRKLDQQRRQLKDELGLDVVLADEWLPQLVDNIGLWQRSSTEADGAQKSLQASQDEQAAILREIRTALDPFGYTSIDSAEAAAQSIEDLAVRQSRRSRAVSDLADAQRQIEQVIKPSLQNVGDQRREIFRRLEIDESDERVIDDWLAELPTYEDLNDQLSDAEAIRNNLGTTLAEHGALLELPQAELQRRIDAQERIAAKRDSLSEQIAGIENDIEAAKAGHELLDALEKRDAAAAELAAVRDRNGGAIVGALLAKWVRTVAVERTRPQVFRRANELLVKFTRGTLQLELDDQATPPSFLARRGSGPPRPVQELSVGERVQLLIAVRVAFLEQDEQAKVPLLLDEALGTSDDGRAGMIIDTVIDLARDGRQVFYFTAQQDEVGKWAARLNAAGTPHRVIDLAQTRRLIAAAATPLPIAVIEVPQPPAPEGMSRSEYGRVLNIPGINPAVKTLDELHLWHLVDDLGLLHELLCRQITTWGQLRTLLEHGGAGLVDAADKQFERVRIAAKAVAACCRYWQMGRGEIVDRQTLVDADCVSDKFVDELSALAKEYGGSAETLLAALEDGQVKRWRTQNTDRLRVYFEEHGHLSSDPRLPLEEIRLRTLAAVADHVRNGLLDQVWLDRLVAQLPS